MDIVRRVGEAYGHRQPEEKDVEDVVEWLNQHNCKPCFCKDCHDAVEYNLPAPLFQDGLMLASTAEGLDELRKDHLLKEYKEQLSGPKSESGLTFVKPRVVGGDFDFILNPLEGETDGCFPRGEVSLIAASSGGGKTTLMMTLLEDQKAARPVFSHTTNGLPYLLVLEDRSEASLRRTFKRMRLDIEKTPYRLLDRKDKSLSQTIADILDTTEPTPAVLFIEGLDLATEDAGKMEAVSRTLKSLQRVAQHYHVAIIGSVGCPKMKPKDRYTSLRDTVFGSAAWARKVETIMTLQKSEGRDTDEKTVLTILPRNAKLEIYTLKFEGGRLVEAPPEREESVGDNIEDAMERWARSRREPFTRAEFALDFPGSETTTRRRLGKLEAMQIVERSRTIRNGVNVIVYKPKEFTFGLSGATFDVISRPQIEAL